MCKEESITKVKNIKGKTINIELVKYYAKYFENERNIVVTKYIDSKGKFICYKVDVGEKVLKSVKEEKIT